VEEPLRDRSSSQFLPKKRVCPHPWKIRVHSHPGLFPSHNDDPTTFASTDVGLSSLIETHVIQLNLLEVIWIGFKQSWQGIAPSGAILSRVWGVGQLHRGGIFLTSDSGPDGTVPPGVCCSGVTRHTRGRGNVPGTTAIPYLQHRVTYFQTWTDD